jgi:hypothetical protein
VYGNKLGKISVHEKTVGAASAFAWIANPV